MLYMFTCEQGGSSFSLQSDTAR